MTVTRKRDAMTHRSQIQQDAPGLTRPLMRPKRTVEVGNWNVPTFTKVARSHK